MMFDDHYLIVEAAGSWAKGLDSQSWLPWSEGNNGPHFMSFFYVGMVWVFFEVMNFLGLEDPSTQMFWLRMFHAIFSLGIIYYGYKITRKLGSKKDAFLVGLLLALLAYFPNFSVKQLVEMVCIPPLLGSLYFLIREEKYSFKSLLMAGVLAGIAVGIRYQTGLIYLGVGIVLLIQSRWKKAFVLTLISGITFFLTQISDLILWKKPFAQLLAYINHNTTHYEEYVSLPWYTYIITLIGFLIPPISLFMIFGFFRKWKKYLILVLPTLLFLVFHSIYSNKQERFILPIIPIIICVGIVGWNEWKSQSSFWNKNRKLHTGLWTAFWVLNTLVLLVFTTAYTKKEHVETMVYLSKKEDLSRYLLDNRNIDGHTMIPQYYFGNWDFQYVMNKQHQPRWLQDQIVTDQEHPYPNYLVIYSDHLLDERKSEVEKYFGPLKFDTIIEPGSLDRLLHFFNPRNKIERVHIYKIQEIPEGVYLDPKMNE